MVAGLGCRSLRSTAPLLRHHYWHVRSMSWALPVEQSVSRDDWYGRNAGSKVQLLGPNSDYLNNRKALTDQWQSLPEVVQMQVFEEKLKTGNLSRVSSPHTTKSVGLSPEEAWRILKSGLMTLVLHHESRIAAAIGQGFYTIGPCGEELLASMGHVLKLTDPMALHYRHLATQIARHSFSKNADEIIQERARAHTVSSLDPVTGGVHCSLGGDPYSFLVTSTLASQSSPAVGRALGAALAKRLGVTSPFGKRPVSYVSLGDGSVNNAHFLSAFNLASYADFRNFKCPVIFGISDNNICISLKGHGYLQDRFADHLINAVNTVKANGRDFLDIYAKGSEVVRYSRSQNKPSCIIFSNLPRRFGHAATDRQNAYLTEEEIAAAAQDNPLEGACQQLIDEGITTSKAILEELQDLQEKCALSFAQAASEPKVTKESALLRVYPQSELPSAYEDLIERHASVEDRKKSIDGGKRPQVMRKLMNAGFAEQLATRDNLVYMGEDVEHGGYYLVTENLVKKFPARVRDFPPDESSLIGAGIGFSQSGLLPIVEIPYAKYLDCGIDMFHEAAIANWLSDGKQPNGMLFRLQGFDRGVFGGNFHTHNSLTLPPGVDVVCYSNGYDYVRGLRYSMEKAAQGHVVMSVDCTNLLNLRHVLEADDLWRFPMPQQGDTLPWSEVIQYGPKDAKVHIVTYGNGVISALKVQAASQNIGGPSIAVIDTPYLSQIPQGLRQVLRDANTVVFADICKAGQHPYASWITQLNNENLLPDWKCVAAQPTYNPLGSLCTFLQPSDIVEAIQDMTECPYLAAVNVA